MRNLLILSEDQETGRRMADLFRKDGYRVTLADSMAVALEGVLKNRSEVVLLGRSYENMDFTQMVTLLKKCNPKVTVILVSAELAPSTMRRVREEGLFYHALEPLDPEDGDEIRQVVECAFENKKIDDVLTAKRVSYNRNVEKEDIMKGTKTLFSVLALVLATTPALAVDTAKTYQSGVLILLFLGMCGLIVVAQLLPAIRTLLHEMRKSATDASKEKATQSVSKTK
ncbi:MAG TPA: response regulator [Desulfuromonadales bacterium]|nr:response regulator [Desulfuromonadales bacterium]